MATSYIPTDLRKITNNEELINNFLEKMKEKIKDSGEKKKELDDFLVQPIRVKFWKKLAIFILGFDVTYIFRSLDRTSCRINECEKILELSNLYEKLLNNELLTEDEHARISEIILLAKKQKKELDREKSLWMDMLKNPNITHNQKT